MIVKIKNNTIEYKIWCGQGIQPSEYYQIPQDEIRQWSEDVQLIVDISNSNAIVNDGNQDFTNINDGINWLKGNIGKYAPDGKQVIWSTPRRLGTHLVFSGIADSTDVDHENEVEVWNGDKFKFHHQIGEEDIVKDFIFNTIENVTTLNEAYVIWKNCEFDEVSMEILVQATEYEAGTNTNFQTYGPIIVPAAGAEFIATFCNFPAPNLQTVPAAPGPTPTMFLY